MIAALLVFGLIIWALFSAANVAKLAASDAIGNALGLILLFGSLALLVQCQNIRTDMSINWVAYCAKLTSRLEPVDPDPSKSPPVRRKISFWKWEEIESTVPFHILTYDDSKYVPDYWPDFLPKYEVVFDSDRLDAATWGPYAACTRVHSKKSLNSDGANRLSHEKMKIRQNFKKLGIESL